MRKFDKICESIGFDRQAQCPFQDPAPTYNAYKNGQCFNFANREEAKKFSKLVETVQLQNPEREKWYSDRQDLEAKAYEIWYEELKQEYSWMSVKVFNICYNKAYEDGHAYGYDEVASEMDSITDFVNEILNARE